MFRWFNRDNTDQKQWSHPYKSGNKILASASTVTIYHETGPSIVVDILRLCGIIVHVRSSHWERVCLMHQGRFTTSGYSCLSFVQTKLQSEIKWWLRDFMEKGIQFHVNMSSYSKCYFKWYHYMQYFLKLVWHRAHK